MLASLRQGKASLPLRQCPGYKRVYTSSIRLKFGSSNLHWHGPMVGCLIFGCAWAVIPRSQFESSQCEVELSSFSNEVSVIELPEKQNLWRKVQRALRMIRRILKLTLTLAPIVLLYPIQYTLHPKSEGEDAQDVVLEKVELPKGFVGWYYRMCLYCVEWSGAACIKFTQWAGSRPDMFGREFCAVFSQLQDDTTPHAWKYTERALREAYGDDWHKKIHLGEILGSGCIAQVYKGVVLDKNGKEQEVAVKGK